MKNAARKNLSLEEKLKIPVWKLPFSKEVKDELYGKGVRSLKQIYDKCERYPGLSFFPGFKNRVFAESAHLIIAMGLDNKKYPLAEYVDIKIYSHGFLERKRRLKIDAYVNERV